MNYTTEIVDKYEEICAGYQRIIQKHESARQTLNSLLDQWTQMLEKVEADPFNEWNARRLSTVIESMRKIHKTNS